MNDRDEAFESRLRQALEQRAERLDADTRAALAQARRRALAARGGRDPVPLRPALASLLVLAVGLSLVWWTPAPRPPQSIAPLDVDPALMEDWAWLADAEDLQFYEDLDLVLWLDAQAPEHAPQDSDDAADPAPAGGGDGTGTGRG